MGFQGINTSYTAIRAAQAALATTSNNIANANTDGYTRQRVELSGRNPYDSPTGLLGQGVDVNDVTRQRSLFLDERARLENSRLGFLQGRSDLLVQAEIRFGELDAGIDVAMSDLFAALEELSLHPDRTPVGQTVIAAMDSLASRLRATAKGVEELVQVGVTRINDLVSDANRMIEEIARLNGEIVALSGSGSANDLMDRRDRLVDELASTIGASAIPAEDGAIRVSLNGLSLVDGTASTTLVANSDGSVTHPDAPLAPGGEVGGVQAFLNQDLAVILADLDQFATDLAAAFNTQNALGFTAPGVPGGALFDATMGATNFTLLTTDPLAIARAGDPLAATFDGTNAAALAALRTDDTFLPSGKTLLEEFRDVVTAVGVRTARVNSDLAGQNALQSTADLARESAHGVNLDEEMAALVTHQRMLEAASRVMSAMDQALDTLINRTGIVGR